MRTFNERLLIESVLNIQSNKILNNSFNFSHNRQKYKLSEYLYEIFYVLKTGIYWRDIRSHINWNSIYKVFTKLNKYNIFESSYKKLLLTKYLKKPPIIN